LSAIIVKIPKFPQWQDKMLWLCLVNKALWWINYQSSHFCDICFIFLFVFSFVMNALIIQKTVRVFFDNNFDLNDLFLNIKAHKGRLKKLSGW